MFTKTFKLSVKVPMPAHRFTSLDWPVVGILITYVTGVLKLASKIYLVKGKTL